MEAKECEKTVSEDKSVEEPMESDEMLSGSESAEITDSSEKATSAEEKSEPSPMPSEPTSGIEVTSRSATSVSEAQCESVENPEFSSMPIEHASGVEKSSAVDSSVSNVAPEEKPELAAVSPEDEDKSKSDVPTLAKLASAVAIRETETSRETSTKPTEPIAATEEKEKSEILASETPCEAVEKLDTAESTENKPPASTKSTPPKKSIFGNIKRFFSPPKSGKSKESRSKSMSPTDETPQPAASGTSIPEDAGAVSEEEDHMKKSGEKSGVIKSIKRSLSKIMVRSKSSNADGTNLVSDEETDKNEEASKPPETKAEASGDTDKCTCNKPVWMENRLSLTERPSWDGTTMTDIPSTTWSGGDVFPNESRRPSEAGENTSEEAVAGSLASSPDEQIPDIKDDAGSVDDKMKKNGVANTDKSKEKVVADSDPEKTSNADKSKDTAISDSGSEKASNADESKDNATADSDPEKASNADESKDNATADSDPEKQPNSQEKE